jgi:hypothetical protein
MGTAYKSDIDSELLGVIPRAVRDIFRMISEKEDSDYVVKVSFIELYNEQLFDLLSQQARREDRMVELREDGKGGIKMPGLTEIAVRTDGSRFMG